MAPCETTHEGRGRRDLLDLDERVLQLAEVDEDALDVRVVLECGHSVLTSEPRLANAAERDQRSWKRGNLLGDHPRSFITVTSGTTLKSLEEDRSFTYHLITDLAQINQ